MILNQLKQIRDELKNSADSYDNAFKKTALIAAQELTEQEIVIDDKQDRGSLLNNNLKENITGSNQNLDKQYFLNKYGSLKNAKAEYKKKYGKQKYGRSWSDFITVAQELSNYNSPKLSLEERITKIENFLVTLGYQHVSVSSTIEIEQSDV